MVWEQGCSHPQNKYKNCTYANCPIYFRLDGGEGFDSFRSKCQFRVALNSGKAIEK